MTAFTPRQGGAIYTANNVRLILDREIGRGGEGSVWSILGESSQIVAKFYHQGLSSEKAKKLEAMCRLKSEKLFAIAAWPSEMLKPDVASSAQGFLMPRISGYREAHLLYTPKSRRTHFPEAQFPFLLHASVNIARAFATVHDAGQVIGDVNHANLMIARDATVRLIDCDSFEITDGRSFFPCPVGVPFYTPPELQGKSFSGVRRTTQHDAFGLAVLLFHMIFLGRHPFAGVFRQGKGDKTIEDSIREYRFAYSPDYRATEMEQPSWVPKLSAFPDDIGVLFTRAFSRQSAGANRPSAHEWIPVLEAFSRNVKRCVATASHHYYQTLTACPWCVAENSSGIPMFGVVVGVVRTTNFDLMAVWAQIEALRPDSVETPRFSDAYAAQCTPDPTIAEAKITRRKRRLMAAGVLFVVVGLVASGNASTIVSVTMLFAGLVMSRALWRSATISADSFIKRRKDAQRGFDAACAQWHTVQHPPAAFAEARKMLELQRQEYEGLSALKAARMNELRSKLRSNQLVRFLEQQHIEDATIVGIGPGRKSLLKAWGIDDASDVTPRISIKGFGPALKSNLLAWRRDLETRFVFNPNEPPDPIDIRTIEQQLMQKSASLIQALSVGPNTLKQMLHAWQVERSKAIANLNYWSKVIAQAEVDNKALGRI